MKTIPTTLSIALALAVLSPPGIAQVAVSTSTLGGSATAADTGAALTGATVLALPVVAPSSQAPVVYKATVDATGSYSLNVPAGQYRLCLRPPPFSLYLDPCQWGSPISATAVSGTAATASLQAQKGVRFIVRVHDPQQLLPQAETVTGAAVTAYVTAPTVPEFPLPVVFSDRAIRDYGTIVPINVALTVTISSGTLTLNDNTGAPLAASAIPFTILPTDIVVTGNPTAPSMFPPPDARIVHVYAAGLK